MAYYPPNKIKTNLYTNGNEFVIKSTNKDYIGYYFSTFEETFFSGKVPSSNNSEELIKKIETDIDFTIPKQVIVPSKVLESKNFIDSEVFKYQDLKNKKQNPYFLPTPYYPQPTEDNYKLGEFQRYFCVKTNELRYTEVTKDQYEKFKNRDESVAWQYYISFSLPWNITGNKEEVYKVNRNIVLITEQNIKRRGLQEFLRKNYLFLCPTPQILLLRY